MATNSEITKGRQEAYAALFIPVEGVTRDPSWGLAPHDILQVTKGCPAMGIRIRETLTVLDVYQRAGDRQCSVRVLTRQGAIQVWTVPGPTYLNRADMALLRDPSLRITVSRKA